MKYKNIVLATSVVALIAPSVAIEANAYETELYLAVTKGDVLVKSYAEPSSKSKFMYYLNPGKVYPIYDMTVDGWCKVMVSGDYCWVLRSEMQNITQLKTQKYYAVGKETVDIYNGIYSNNKVVRTVKKGEEITTVGDSVYLFNNNNIENEFLRVKVEYEEIEYHYVPKKYFNTSKNISEKEIYISKGVKLYNAPIDEIISIGSTSEAGNVIVLDSTNGYSRIKYKDDIYYVKNSDIGFESKYMYLNTSKVEKTAVYESASSSSKKLGNMYSDVARYVINVVDGYAQIEYGDGIGYVKYSDLVEDRITETKYINKATKATEKYNNTKVTMNLSKGDKVTVIGYRNDLARVKVDGVTGYIDKSILVDKKPSLFEAKYMYLNTNKVVKTAVYESASSSKKLGNMYSDIARYVTDVIDGYAQIEYGNGIGYVKYSNLVEKRITETKYINKATKATEKYNNTKVVMNLSKGDKVTVIGYRNDLARVKVNGVTGYIDKSILVDKKPSLFEAKYMYLNTNKVEKTAVYENASSSSKKLGNMYSDVARYVTNVVDGYAQIEYGSGIGYVKYSDLVEKRITETKYVNKATKATEKYNNTKVSINLSKGDKITVIGYRNDLARVKVNGVTGYVPKDILVAKKSQIFKDRYMYLNINKVTKTAVYESASSSSKKLGNIYSDVARYVTDIVDGYAQIKYGDGVGYVKYSDLVEKRITEIMYMKEFSNATEKYNNTNVAIKLSKGDKVTVIGYRNDLARVKVNGITGYVPQNVLMKDQLIYLNTPTSNATLSTRYSLEDKVSVYSDRELDKPIGLLRKGDKVEYIESISTNVSRIKVNDMVTGYISSNDISHKKPSVKNTTKVVNKKLSITHEEYVDTQVGSLYTSIEDIRKYSNPLNYSLNNADEKYQFLKIDTFRDINVYELNEYLNSLSVKSGQAAIFKDKAEDFISAARNNNIDPIYLVAHTMLETGYGSSQLAQGITVTEDAQGNSIEPTKVYNLFGIGAVDGSANSSGAKTAYTLGWTSIKKAINGAAKWIATGVEANPTIGLKASNGYIHSSKFTEQYNLYSMRWDYVYGWHQYASDPQWALKISKLMNKLSYLYEGVELVFENIEYKASPKLEVLDEVEYREISSKAVLRSGPSDKFRIIATVELGGIVELKGYSNGYALIKYEGEEMYVKENSLSKVDSEEIAVISKVEENIEDAKIEEVKEEINFKNIDIETLEVEEIK